MATYAEYLRANGATDADITVLDTPVAQRAFTAMQTQVAAETKRAKEVIDANNNWRDNVVNPLLEKTSVERDLALADRAAMATRLKVLEDAGHIAKEPPPPAVAASPNGFDPNKYVPREDFLKLARATADADDLAYDIAAEHARLFPDKQLRMRELRQKAIANNTSIEQQWLTDYNVQSAREAKATSDAAAQQARWKAEGAKEAEAALAAKYGSPETRPAVPSNSPFTNKTQPTAADGRVLQPWEKTEGERSMARVRGAVAAGQQVN